MSVQIGAAQKKGQELLESLPQGHGSSLDADKVDGKHTSELGGSSECPYDIDDNGIIDNSEKLEGKTLAEVQNRLIPSNPPEGKKKITNIYWDQATQELVFEHEE